MKLLSSPLHFAAKPKSLVPPPKTTLAGPAAAEATPRSPSSYLMLSLSLSVSLSLSLSLSLFLSLSHSLFRCPSFPHFQFPFIYFKRKFWYALVILRFLLYCFQLFSAAKCWIGNRGGSGLRYLVSVWDIEHGDRNLEHSSHVGRRVCHVDGGVSEAT